MLNRSSDLGKLQCSKFTDLFKVYRPVGKLQQPASNLMFKVKKFNFLDLFLMKASLTDTNI